VNVLLAVSWSELLSEVFAGVAALGAMAVVVASAITIRYTRRALEGARAASVGSAHRRQIAVVRWPSLSSSAVWTEDQIRQRR